jgi:hypothetical protein
MYFMKQLTANLRVSNGVTCKIAKFVNGGIGFDANGVTEL